MDHTKLMLTFLFTIVLGLSESAATQHHGCAMQPHMKVDVPPPPPTIVNQVGIAPGSGTLLINVDSTATATDAVCVTRP